MPSFYVQCGPIESIVTAESAESAALSALDQSLQTHLWIYDDPGLSQRQCRDHLMLEALCHLDPEVAVQEKGTEAQACHYFGTPEVIERWHRLMVGTRRLLIAAGLSPRPLACAALDSNEHLARVPR